MHDGREKIGVASAIDADRDGADVRAALEACFRKYFRELVGMLRKRVNDPEQAADLAQTAFARLAGRIDDPQALDHARAHLMQIARNATVDHVRKEAVQRKYEREAATAFGTGEADTRTPEEVALQRQRLARLEEIIRVLPRMRRRIFILSRLHGLSAAEIAEQEGMSKRAVRGHIERALADIRAKMGDTSSGQRTSSGDPP